MVSRPSHSSEIRKASVLSMIPFLPIAQAAGGFIADNWKIFAILALLAAAYVKGCSDEKERFDQFRAAVEATGRAQEELTKARISQSQSITTEQNDAYEKKLAELSITNSGLRARLRTDTSRGVVPPVPSTAQGSPGTICFERDKLNRGILSALDTLLTGVAGVLQRGDEAGVALRTCAAWAIEQQKLNRTTPP